VGQINTGLLVHRVGGKAGGSAESPMNVKAAWAIQPRAHFLRRSCEEV